MSDQGINFSNENQAACDPLQRALYHIQIAMEVRKGLIDSRNVVIEDYTKILRQIEELADLLLKKFGGPKFNESAVEMAIRLLEEYLKLQDPKIEVHNTI